MTSTARQTLALITRVFAHYGYPLIVTSTDRTAAKNREVGGAENSLHLIGRAADVVPSPAWAVPGASRIIIDVALLLGASWALDEGDHVHIEFPA